jgi:hypothetical protein
MPDPTVTPQLTYATAVEYLKGVDTPTLANAAETLAIRPNHEGFTPGEIRCLFPELGRLCGYAVTAHVETIPPRLLLSSALPPRLRRPPYPQVTSFRIVFGKPCEPVAWKRNLPAISSVHPEHVLRTVGYRRQRSQILVQGQRSPSRHNRYPCSQRAATTAVAGARGRQTGP